MTDKLILEKLEKMEMKVDKIESAISLLAVQSERLDNISAQTKSLWQKYDSAFKPGGYVDKIKIKQASCPRETMKQRFKELWVAYALLAAIVVGCLFKAKGGV